MEPLEKEFFENKDFWGYINSKEHRAIVAKAAAALCEEKIKAAIELAREEKQNEICTKCGKLMCDNFINTGSCSQETIFDFESILDKPKIVFKYTPEEILQKVNDEKN